jgi:two-component system, OmpR family, alkaline phosphatase synthesis response regulator PhoP
MDKKGRVLVVDDDHAIRKLLERIAKRAGFEVESAKDGAEALEMIEAREYDVALVDLMMPRLSGYELVQRISTREQRPVVIVATALTNSDLATVDDTLVRHVVRKPFDVQAIVTSLTDAMQHVAAKRDMLIVAAPAPEPAENEKASDEAPAVNLEAPC